MAFVQGDSGHQAMSPVAGGEQPGMADPMMHGVSGPQEPLSPDHQFVDAQIDHGSAHGLGSDTHAMMFHGDASAVAAPVPADPLPTEHLAHGGG
jgi:hypothetical protein